MASLQIDHDGDSVRHAITSTTTGTTTETGGTAGDENVVGAWWRQEADALAGDWTRL